MTAEMAETERSRAELRRGQILEAAHACFSREGFHAASMASIAAQADLSVGQIYRYFENKEAVIEALCVSKLEEWAERLAEVRSRSGDPVDELMALARYHVDKLDNGQDVSMVLEFLAEAARNPRVGAVMHRVDTGFRGHLRDVFIRGGVRADDPSLESRVSIVSVLLDGWLVRLGKEPTASKEEYLQSLRFMFEALLSQCDRA
jgi:AcrR family transcriptional regulator